MSVRLGRLVSSALVEVIFAANSVEDVCFPLSARLHVSVRSFLRQSFTHQTFMKYLHRP